VKREETDKDNNGNEIKSGHFFSLSSHGWRDSEKQWGP
jgi:hypothetical protein